MSWNLMTNNSVNSKVTRNQQFELTVPRFYLFTLGASKNEFRTVLQTSFPFMDINIDK